MKKILKSRIFIFIISGIIFGSVGVYAATQYKAEDIKYNNTTVKQAVDTLYDKINFGNIDDTKVLTGYNALSNGNKIYGSMEDNSGWNYDLTSSNRVTIPKGYHDGTGYVDATKLTNNSCNLNINYHQHTSSCSCNGAIVARPKNNNNNTSYVTYQCAKCGDIVGQDGYGQGRFWEFINKPSGTAVGGTHNKLICGKSTTYIESIVVNGKTYEIG